ncbi:MAG: hypothetical protein K5989_07275, partial [Lachnospiraceae bacterium]|nr:hypothetical protein [Lachnospiraceae bacterium]
APHIVSLNMAYPKTDGTYDYSVKCEYEVENGDRLTVTNPMEAGQETNLTEEDGVVYYELTSGSDTYRWRFDGWYYDDSETGKPVRSDLTEKYNNSLPVTDDLMLYGRWTQTAGPITITVHPIDESTGNELENCSWTQSAQIGSSATIRAKNSLSVSVNGEKVNYWPVDAVYIIETVDGDSTDVNLTYKQGESWKYCIDSYMSYSNSSGDKVYFLIESQEGYTDAEVEEVLANPTSVMKGYHFYASEQTYFIQTGNYAQINKPSDDSVPHVAAFYSPDTTAVTFVSEMEWDRNATGRLSASPFLTYAYYGLDGAGNVRTGLPGYGVSKVYSDEMASGTVTTAVAADGDSYSLKEIYSLTDEAGNAVSYEDAGNFVTYYGVSPDTYPTGEVQAAAAFDSLAPGKYAVTSRIVLVKDTAPAAAVASFWTGTGTADLWISPYEITLTGNTGESTLETVTLYYDGKEEKLYSDRALTHELTEGAIDLSATGDSDPDGVAAVLKNIYDYYTDTYTAGFGGFYLTDGSSLAGVTDGILYVETDGLTGDRAAEACSADVSGTGLPSVLRINMDMDGDGVTDTIVYYDGSKYYSDRALENEISNISGF